MQQNLNLQGKVALITGSTSGIGLEIGKFLLQTGAFCYFNSPFESEKTALLDTLQKVIDRTTKKPVNIKEKVRYICSDISDRLGCEYLVNEIKSSSIPKSQAIDILINNAGLQYVAAIESLPIEKWQELINLNLTAPFNLISLLVEGMKKNNWGRIVNISSAHGLRASPFKSAYISSKHGVIGLTKTVALELAKTRITCNSICPGYVRTLLVEKQINSQAQAHNLSKDQVIKDIILAPQPSGQFTKVEDIAAMVIHLCSKFSNNITGTHISIDGGWTAK